MQDESTIEKHLARLQEKRTRIFEMREEGSYTKEEFLERKQNVEDEILTATLSLNESRMESFDIEGALNYAINFIRNLGRQWLDLPTELRFRFQKLIFPAGISYNKNSKFGTLN